MNFFEVAYFLKKVEKFFKDVKLKCSFKTSFMGKMPFFLHGKLSLG